MKLYVCYGTWTAGRSIHRHPCGEAHEALTGAGHRPEVVRSYGLGLLPAALNAPFRGRREVQEMTGDSWVPVLVLDDGTIIQGSERIIEWAHGHPAAPAGGPASAGAVAGGPVPPGAHPTGPVDATAP